MGFAFGLLVSKKFKLIDDSRNEALFSKGISWLLAVLAVCGLLVSWFAGLNTEWEHMAQ